MKNLFSAIVNGSLFGYTKRLAILCVFLSISVVAISNETTKYAKLTAKIHTKSTGSGCVYVKEGNTSSKKVCNQDESSERSTSVKNNGSTYEFTFTLNAEADKGSYVAGWTQSSTSLESLEGGTTHTVKLNGTEKEGEVSETWFAVFKPIVALPQPNKVSIKVVGGESSSTMVRLPEVVNTTQLTLSIEGDDTQNSWFQLSKDDITYSNSISFASSASELSANGRVTDLPFYVKFVGTIDNATNYNKNVVVRVTASEEAPGISWDIPIEVTSEYDTYQFLRPQIVGVTNYEGIDFGSYTATLANPDNTLISIINSDSDPISLSTSGHYSVTLKATPSNSYKFYGWYKITFYEDGTEKNPVLISQSATYGPVDFKESAKIYPLYVRSEHALFRIKEDVNGKLYYDLQEALDVASGDESYSTVVFNAPAKGTTGTLYPKDGGSAYTIPQGVTLLIPGDAAYTCRTEYSSSLPDSDFPADTVSSQYSYYSKITLAANTKITLQGGNICVYSTLSSQQPNNGSPIRYGWIEMGENCEIATTSGQKSFLYVLGYITGPSSLSSSIKLNGSSIAYEAFQIPDFRGGKALAPLIGLGVTSNDKGVFPSEQFYIQNIEVPMTIQSGATLKCMAAANVSMVGLQHTEIDLIAKSSGLIQLKDNVELVKYYDSERDVQVYHVKGKGAAQSIATLGNVSVDISMISMDTKNFVLPITSNMELIFDNVTMSSANRVGMLAGSKIWIKENAILNQSAQFYVHDKVENRYVGTDGYPGYKGYFGSRNEELIPVRHTPNGTHRKRTVKDLTSAQLRVDGQLNITDKGLYTTASGADIVSFKDGAQIKISKSYKEVATNEKLYRLRQNSNEAVSYPELKINPAWLKNSNGDYVKTTGDAVTYKYYITGTDQNGNPIGIWSLPPATVTDDSWSGTSVTATMPTTPVDMTITCNVENVGSDSYANAFIATLSNTTNFAFADNKFSFDAETKTLSIHVKYTPRDNTATDATTTLTLKNTTIPTAEYTYTTTLTATEEYVPVFTVSKSTVQLPTVTTLGGTSTVDDAFTITPEENNVAGISDSRLVWTYELSSSDFGYTQGKLNNGEIANNKVTFTTSTAGTKNATLTIKATYTPKNGGEPKYCTAEIGLTGTTDIVNTLGYDMPDQIWVTDKNVPVQFTAQNNTSKITVTLVNADDTKPAAELIDNGDGTYSINALNAGTFTLYASQNTSGGVASVTDLPKIITVAKRNPEPVWNWGVVYGNQSYALPFDPTTVVDGKWTLEETTDLVNALAYDENRHTIQVMNVGATTSAQFIFKQDETDIYNAFTQSYSVTINPDPRILTLVVDNKAKFDITVSGEHSSGVVCDATGSITLPANGYVIVQFIGIPGDLTFQLNDGAGYNSILVAENTDKASDDTWQVITKSGSEAKWVFANTTSTCVKLTNNSANSVTLSNLTITENSNYDRNTYYAKAEAIVSPAQAGTVAAKGNYLSVNSNNEKLFTTYSPFASTATAYSLAESEIVSINDKFAFSFQAQSTPGYYFSNWTSVGNPMITDGLSWSDMNSNYELYLTTTASDKSIAYPFDTYINLFCQQNQEVCLAAKPESGEPNQQAVAYMNAGALALIPAANVGTWQANFELAEVVGVENVAWESNSPNSTDVAKENAVFNVLGDDANDFEASINGNGFSFVESDIILSTINNTYTVNVSYTPQDIHGTHTATLTLSRVAIEGVDKTSSKSAILTITENLTPSFTLSDAAFGSGTLGQETILDIVPTEKNKVAQVSDPDKIKWDAELSDGAPFEILSVAADGTCRVRYFRTAQGNKSATLTLTATYTDSKGTEVSKSIDCNLSGSATADKTVNTLTLKQDIVVYVDDAPFSIFDSNDPNNTAPITITLPEGCTALVIEDGMLKPSGNFATGTYTIKVSQVANDYFQASGELTTTVTVKKHTPEVTWNLPQLYFGQTYDNPITTNSDGALNITSSGGVGASIIKINASKGTIEVDPLTEGEYNVRFTVSIAASNLYEAFTNTYDAIIYRDPRHLRVDVNSSAVYQAVTIASQTGANVSYSNDAICFADVAGSEYTSRQWTMYFIGVPDQLVFTPTGNNAWQIQESPNGSNWNTTYASAKIPAGKQFSMSLRPNTRYVRISYASNADSPSNGELNSFYITPLQGVKANEDALYLPISTDPENPTTKSVTIQYASTEELIVYTSDSQFTPNVYSLPALDEGVYAEQTIIIESEATVEKEAQLYIKNIEEGLFFELPLYSFVFPQELPIQLATDNAHRFHYLVIASNYAKWDMDTRTITLQNASPNAVRSFTFAFEGAPNVIRFNQTASDRGVWTIRESANNADWYETDPTTRVVDGSEIEQGLLNTTRYVKVEYSSPYSEAVEISNLIIVGNASVITDVTKLELTDQQPTKEFTITAINLANFDVLIDNANFTANFDKSSLTATGVVNVPVSITWTPDAAIDNAILTIVNPNDANAVLAIVELLGTKSSIIDPANTGIYTGIASKITNLSGSFEGYQRRPVDLTNAYDAATGTKALFDYLYIYGETSTMDGSTVITTPTTQRGSNAKTPCYIYERVGETYKLIKVVDNVNSSEKAISGAIMAPVNQSGVSTRIYITGFAPYASTGYTKQEEGVWLFRGEAGSKLDIYLEDCYIYSRYKTIDGHSFLNRENGESFSEGYARGSGGVLVFECSSLSNTNNPFDVTIHTRDRNLLKSHYGCFMSSIAGRAFQVSSPVQVHMMSSDMSATTHLSFDDIWPTSITRTITGGVVTSENLETTRTNGFLSLQKQVNNAPSIDLGTAKTVVNFNGGQVELQNAQNVSDNYTSTLAISHREGKFAGFTLATGVGSDGVGGTVNFNDGTTTVITMPVDERYRQYYLMDENGTTTSCLRCPQNTYVYGGSHCMMRACSEPTSKGGAPTNGPTGDALGLYQYPKNPETGKKGGWSDGVNGLVTPTVGNVPDGYNVNSVTPNNNGTLGNVDDDFLNFWFDPDFEPAAKPEVDQKVSFWKACMTEIAADYAGYGGVIGGDIEIAMNGEVQTEHVSNLLYCTIDLDIHETINDESYSAPVKSPLPSGDPYLYVKPSSVGEQYQHYIANDKDYRIEDKVYYITTATADTWMTFTAPFDVENVYVMETYTEAELVNYSLNVDGDENPRQQTKKYQAVHNANFAAFFGVAMVIHPNKTFDMIYNDYIVWAESQGFDVGKYPLIPYKTNNWQEANCYMYKNTADWGLMVEEYEDEYGTYEEYVYDPKWEFLQNGENDPLMERGETYSILLPYCVGCDEDEDSRQEWDYWSGKFLIFESTTGPHIIKGGEFVGTTISSKVLDPKYDATKEKYLYEFNYGGLTDGDGVFAQEVDSENGIENQTDTESNSKLAVKGNSTFAQMMTDNENVFVYNGTMNYETFDALGGEETIEPTIAFLYGNVPVNDEGAHALSVSRIGKIKYRPSSGNNGDTPTGGHVPTIADGSDIFVMGTATGINIAVSDPQYVGVFSATGQLIYSGWVETSVDVNLVVDGVYVVVGENESMKVIY